MFRREFLKSGAAITGCFATLNVTKFISSLNDLEPLTADNLEALAIEIFPKANALLEEDMCSLGFFQATERFCGIVKYETEHITTVGQMRKILTENYDEVMRMDLDFVYKFKRGGLNLSENRRKRGVFMIYSGLISNAICLHNQKNGVQSGLNPDVYKFKFIGKA